jgi:hypothetical protein
MFCLNVHRNLGNSIQIREILAVEIRIMKYATTSVLMQAAGVLPGDYGNIGATAGYSSGLECMSLLQQLIAHFMGTDLKW